MVIKDDPITLATYARKHSLLNEPGWKKLKTIARRLVHDKQGVYHLHYTVMANKQTKGPVYQFGIQVPCNVKDAYKLDKKNGNTKWQDAMQEEINSLLDYSTFEDKGKLNTKQVIKISASISSLLSNMTYVTKPDWSLVVIWPTQIPLIIHTLALYPFVACVLPLLLLN